MKEFSDHLWQVATWRQESLKDLILSHIFHSSSLGIARCLASEGLIPVYALCTNPFPTVQMGRVVTPEVSLLGERDWGETSVIKGDKNPALLPNFFSKDMCLLVLQLLFPAKLSLISFVRHYVHMCLCGERGTPWLSWVPVVPSHVSSVGYINGAWRWNADTFQWTTAKKPKQTILGLPRYAFNSSYKHQTNYSTFFPHLYLKNRNRQVLKASSLCAAGAIWE